MTWSKLKSPYRCLFRAGSVLIVFWLILVVAPSCNRENSLTYEVSGELVGPPTAEEHMAITGSNPPDTFIVTAYLAIDEYEKRFHGITFSGVPAKPFHTVAVDPSVVPMGTWVYIEGLGWWRAEDTGNMIKGNHLDICLPTRDEARRWGKRKRRVWCLIPDTPDEGPNTDNAAVNGDSSSTAI
jgi:3D (Asp-Asp-Asp) domain-containing protein